ncbi:MAG: GNAT family N-acetyltransferase [Thermoplasmata archaeon]|nr:GNAT family N-acetyltransferase [Thermoplasmata archaeon]
MSVEVLAYDELPTRLTPQVAALDATDGDAPLDRSAIRRAARLGLPFSEYVALFAVDGDELLSRVTVIRRTLTTEQGPELFAGITDVVTRPGAGRRGLAGRVLRAVHARERSRGVQWALLWTHPSWGAHRLYERLGYRDLYSPPVAVRRLPARPHPRPRGYSLRRAGASDGRLLDSLFDRASRGRVGFLPRPRGSHRLRIAMGWRAARDHYVILQRSRPVGYAFAPQGPRALTVQEGVASEEKHLPALLDLIEREAHGRWLTFTATTFARDAGGLLARRGYTMWPSSHFTLMGRRIGTGSPALPSTFRKLFDDPRFSCHRSDIF